MAAVNMTSDQLRELVTSLTTAALQAASTSVPPSSFANASFSFDGARDTARVEEFLTAATIYKAVQKMSDADAILSLPLVLKGEAATWWHGVKEGINKWTHFEKLLRHAFAPKKPAYLIYQEVFSQKQPFNMLTESFVAKNRALLAQISAPGHTEEQQLNMIYGQLHIKIRERVPRDSVTSFDSLLEAARGIEQLLKEKASTLLVDTSTPGTISKRKKSRCDFCRAIGHTIEECRKRASFNDRKLTGRLIQNDETKVKMEVAATQAPSPSQFTISCYGCGTPGVMRSKCPNCLSRRS